MTVIPPEVPPVVTFWRGTPRVFDTPLFENRHSDRVFCGIISFYSITIPNVVLKSTMSTTQEHNFINEVTIQYEKKPIVHMLIKTSEDAAKLMRGIYRNTGCGIELKEYFFILLLNRANQVTGYHKLSEGGICGTVVDMRLAYATIIKSLSAAVILCHNHPSGNLMASNEDIAITKRFCEVGKLLDITVLDHIIITKEGYYSFADNGIL